MRRRLVHLAACLVLSAAFASSVVSLTAQIQAAAQSKAKAGQKGGRPATQQHQDTGEGQRIFEQNCSRCHNSPEGFSPNISGTIVRHMRVRASLSKHEEEELLRFFNP
jgi:cytochrome c5